MRKLRGSGASRRFKESKERSSSGVWNLNKWQLEMSETKNTTVNMGDLGYIHIYIIYIVE